VVLGRKESLILKTMGGIISLVVALASVMIFISQSQDNIQYCQRTLAFYDSRVVGLPFEVVIVQHERS
jgi:hypothetical protein